MTLFAALLFAAGAGNGAAQNGVDPSAYSALAPLLPGYVAGTNNNQQDWDYMGAVTFTPAYRFRSQLKNPVTGNGSGMRMYGFSIPLIGDLDGDTYPEVIGISCQGRGSLNGNYNGIFIFNGQDGTIINRLYFPGCSASGGNYSHSGHHGAPSIMALVDSDRDGTVELIVAFPNSYSGTTNSGRYASRVASFNINYDAVMKSYSLTENWLSKDRYNDGLTDYEKPIPQVVDFDGDGQVEVLVYHKIYDASPRNGGRLLLSMSGGLGTTTTHTYVGVDQNAPGGSGRDKYIGFNYVYDMDGDGIYDIVAGGKIYKLAKNSDGTFSATVITNLSLKIPDGRTGVADINGDGIPDVVTTNRESGGMLSATTVAVWEPRFQRLNAAGQIEKTPNWTEDSIRLMARRTLTMAGSGGTGSNSYVYIGDIDGREQTVTRGGVTKKYRLPEIAILTRRLELSAANFPPHSNLSSWPADVFSSFRWSNNNDDGCIFALTYDYATNDLRASFLLEHDDSSTDTGFTMFDFDNDGIQEICYRDMQTLRILKPTKPTIGLKETDPSIILFNQTVRSYTGFEYPVIADIDNDASAEMIVMGHEDASNNPWGYIYAVGNGTGDKFAPALAVWNQFMYDPFKIKEDLTTPVGPAINRLDAAIRSFRREIKNENNQVIQTIENMNPFNGTLMQVPRFDGNLLPNYEPIVYLTDAFIVDNYDANISRRPSVSLVSPWYMEISIGNRANAKADISSNIPVSVYHNGRIAHENRTKYTLAGLINAATGAAVGSATIAPDHFIRVRIPVPDPDGVYIVRLGDDSDGTAWRFGINKDGDIYTGIDFNQGIGRASRAFRDRYWPDQTVRIARFNAFNDFYTVQEFKEVEMNLLENDILPDMFLPTLTLSSVHVTESPKAGYLTFNDVAGAGSRVIYHHKDSVILTAAIDSFRYQLTFQDPTNQNVRLTKNAQVYIYVMESATTGFAACYGEPARVELRNLPDGINFDWYASQTSDVVTGTGRIRYMLPITGDSTYWPKPVMTHITAMPGFTEAQIAHYGTFDFPRGKLVVSISTKSPTATLLMRWTGLVGPNWKDPDNWVEVKTQSPGNDYETPAAWAPTRCTDVILSSNAPYYPELVDPVVCKNITVRNRAMLKNPHMLTYDSACVEIRLKPSERDRFVMWSAPLMDMYSGDYHFKSGRFPQWGDVHMNLFQQANPGGGIASANAFTATFGRLDQTLDLGRAFNLRVTSTSVTKESHWRFPQTDPMYTDDKGDSYPLPSRADGYRFITSNVKMASDTTFTLAIHGDNAYGNLVQVVNPYLAYLDVTKFLQGNSATLSQAGYLIWDGVFNNSFSAIATGGNRYIYTAPSLAPSPSPNLIPPLQSFFVQKKNPVVHLASVRMSPNWTTANSSHPYILRAATVEEESGILHIKAVQGNNTGYALLQYDPDASPAYDGDEDIRSLFYEEIPLTLYSLTARKEPLAIHASNDFRLHNTDLGLRIMYAGETKLLFSGLENFGHDVYLIDKEKNREINLQETPEYTFTATKPAGVKAVELNDRFTLRTDYTGKGLTDTQPVAAETLMVSATDGTICVHSTAGLIRSVRIYNIGGVMVYGSHAASERFLVPVERGQVYLVKAQVGNKAHEMRKVWVK
jgi:hypothetical protein